MRCGGTHACPRQMVGGIRDQENHNVPRIDEGIRPVAGGARDLNVTVRQSHLNPEESGNSNEDLDQKLTRIMGIFTTKISEKLEKVESYVESNTASIQAQLETNAASLRKDSASLRADVKAILTKHSEETTSKLLKVRVEMLTDFEDKLKKRDIDMGRKFDDLSQQERKGYIIGGRNPIRLCRRLYHP